ncbi:hypothetical protein TVAG_076430 [Trichomonas vaginalis G3]|uniref:Uncharacterized protein n=1 Tax=Trichomonas vaginalis (strain ATCC PRA-98 / G3) TaxID=412133 RepID=A2D9P0_TRIV3|nr:hypothetical protein TVAGG3_0292570 [Trichomonas vaginalis G3]EAY22896.1 hypothetical protein TVAG_076430 [Trichomonas vaginalis G3]KAI5527388.1 hypothetical protein TVAGG3_0292570 [Trichomonas vaginalis G3]|eukprot:XP_001583882.1 hypothetical protein [Trichomonas vaginalis G3]
MKSERSTLLELKNKIATQRVNLSREGLVDLKNIEIPSFTPLGIQPKMKTLNVSNSNIISFETLPAEPVLSTIIANNTPLNSYLGFSRQNRLANVCVKNTPLSERQYFRIELLIVVGQHLMKINGELISPQEREIASQYPIIAQALIESGWSLVYPCPKIEEFRDLAIQFNLRFKGVDKQFTNEIAEQHFKPPPVLPIIQNMHETLISVPPAIFKENPIKQEKEMMQDKQMLMDLCKELERVGIFIPKDENIEENVFNAVQGLVEIVKKLDPCADELLKLTEQDEQ